MAQSEVTSADRFFRLFVASHYGRAPMIRSAKDLSPDQKEAIERLLGRAIAENEQVSVRTVPSAPPPDWLKQSWGSAKR